MVDGEFNEQELIQPEKSMFRTRVPRSAKANNHLWIVILVVAVTLVIALLCGDFGFRVNPNSQLGRDQIHLQRGP